MFSLSEESNLIDDLVLISCISFHYRFFKKWYLNWNTNFLINLKKSQNFIKFP